MSLKEKHPSGGVLYSGIPKRFLPTHSLPIAPIAKLTERLGILACGCLHMASKKCKTWLLVRANIPIGSVAIGTIVYQYLINFGR